MKHALTLGLLIFLMTPYSFAQKFRSDDPVWVDSDSTVTVTSIAKHKLNDQYDFLLNTFGHPGDSTPRQAVNINTLGEVPDSSWFQNRHGLRRMTVEDLVRGPNMGDGPSLDAPLLVIGAKTEGITPGFRVRDVRGDIYFLKFDPPSNPEMTTAAEVISTKFFHAIGYNVPENYLVFFSRQQLRVDAKAKVSDAVGRERRLTDADLDAILNRIHKSSDGNYRAVASRLLTGTPIGPFQYFGTRPDDPNDIFPHEHRRELRGLRVFAAWLNHDDSRAINSLDMLVGNENHKHVRHYLIDFGSTLGSGSVGPQKVRAGWEYVWEPASVIKRIVSLGFWDKDWIRVDYPDYAAVGRFESAHFKPESWKPEYPNPAFSNLTDEDAYWAAKIVMAFTEEQIGAIVKTGRISDPAAEKYLVDTLISRRDKIGRYWLTRRSSFDSFQLVNGVLQFEHLASKYDFVRKPEFMLRTFNIDAASGDLPYTVTELCSSDGTVLVYTRNSPSGTEIVGVER
jgi:hypothetical protein